MSLKQVMPARLLLVVLLYFCCWESRAQSSTNIAIGRPVEASGAVWSGLTPAALTDGDSSTFCHPLAASGTTGYYFEVDLGKSVAIDRIVLRNRSGCCPERLTRYRVEIYSDIGGEPGSLNWSARIRGDGTNSGDGGTDTIRATNNAAGLFSGRFVRIVNESGLGYSPQVAEVEVYTFPAPTIRAFTADEDTLQPGQSTTLRWSIEGGTGAILSPGIGPINPTNGFVTISPTETTTYTLTASNAVGTSVSKITIGVGVTLAPPEITEFMADNTSTLKDADRDDSDWIELYNPNSYSLPLQGYQLTPDPATAAWFFPATRIPPRGFLVVFASGKNRAAVGAELHTNFKLDAKGGYLALLDSAGRTIQQYPGNFPASVNYPPQIKNVSYGRGVDALEGFMRPSTPGETNGRSYGGVVGDTKFSIDRGIYDTNLLSIEITCSTADAVLRYTTNRSEPTANTGLLYTGPIMLSRSTVIRAGAFKPGWAPSDVDTQSYIFLTNVVTATTMNAAIMRNVTYSNQVRQGLFDVPSVFLTSPSTFNGNTQVKSAVEWYDPSNNSRIQANCAVKQFGGAFTDFPKKSFRLYFKSEYGTPKLRFPLFKGHEQGLAPVEEFNQLELRSGSHDMSQRGFYMSNIFTDDTVLAMGHLNPHGRFVHLFINGGYWGLYHLRERWDGAMHQSYLGGSRTNYESINGNWNVGGWADPGTAYDGDGSTWERIKSLRTNYTAIQQWLDVPEYIDYMLMWMFGGSEDEYRCVGPSVPGSGFKFYLNDADGWFCGSYYCAANDRTTRGSPGRNAGDGPGSIFSTLFKAAHPDYRILLADHIYKAMFNGGPLTAAQNAARLANRTTQIERAFTAEAARWANLTPTQWTSRRDEAFKTWLPKRTTEALAQFRSAGFYPSLAAPVLNQQGGQVVAGFGLSFTPPSQGSIYFTLDGSDPRLPGGAINPRATQFTTGQPVLINANSFLRSRARSGTNWSAMNEAFFQTASDPVSPGEVVISELDLDPTGRGSEFVELLNRSGQAVNLRGASFTDGLDFSFPTNRDTVLVPGGRLAIVKDLFRFQQVQGNAVPVAGIYAGSVNKTGEKIVLSSAAGIALCTLSYKTAAPWPSISASQPFTLVLAHADAPESGTSWRVSANPAGSPGFGDSSVFVGDPTADTDGDGLNAVTEYAFGSSDTIAGPAGELIRSQLTEDGWFTVSFQRNPAADDIRMVVESSTDLLHWQNAQMISTEPKPNGFVTETWGFKALSNASAFLRLKVVKP